MDYNDLVQFISELHGANYNNVLKVIKRSKDRANELAQNKNPEDWTQKDLDKSIKQFKQQEYAEKKFAKACEGMTIAQKAQYIKETIATMMDVQPIVCVGQEHPAKKEGKCKSQKEKAL